MHVPCHAKLNGGYRRIKAVEGPGSQSPSVTQNGFARLKQNEKNRYSADTQATSCPGTIAVMFNSYPKGAPS